MELEIQPKATTSRRRRRVTRKGRRFRALCVGWIEAPGFFLAEDLGQRTIPVWAGVATTDASLTPFLANLRAGRRAAEIGNQDRCLVLPDDAEYRIEKQSAQGLTSAAIWHPAIELEPAAGEVVAPQIRFLMRLKSVWIEAQARREEEVIADCLCQYLGRRVRFPIPASIEFRKQLFRKLKAERHVVDDRFTVVGSPPPCRLVGCNIERGALQDVLQQLTTPN
ncbi:MAG: hypothetical protein MPN21_24275 [Thermoanaerobaculia bacterium]|nr:hypothetical protein [Thermoanaerobaculia bacterium]